MSFPLLSEPRGHTVVKGKLICSLRTNFLFSNTPYLVLISRLDLVSIGLPVGLVANRHPRAWPEETRRGNLTGLDVKQRKHWIDNGVSPISVLMFFSQPTMWHPLYDFVDVISASTVALVMSFEDARLRFGVLSGYGLADHPLFYTLDRNHLPAERRH